MFTSKSIQTVQGQVLLAWQHLLWSVRRQQNQLANQLAWKPPLAPGDRRKIEVGDRGLQSYPILKFFFSFLLFLCSECDIENTLFSLSLSLPIPRLLERLKFSLGFVVSGYPALPTLSLCFLSVLFDPNSAIAHRICSSELLQRRLF